MLDMVVLKEQIKSHALAEVPREACGLIVNRAGSIEYQPCTNVYPGINKFILDPIEFANAEDSGTIVAIVHSHVTQGTELSRADQACKNRDSIPWVVYSVATDAFALHEKAKITADYLGRDYIFGVQDCYTLIQDFYIREFNIELPDCVDRDPLDTSYGKGLHRSFEAYGFQEIPIKSLRRGDCIILCSSLTTSEPSHAAIYLEGNVILHHPANRLSCRDVYGGYWLKHTWKCVRHKELI